MMSKSECIDIEQEQSAEKIRRLTEEKKHAIRARRYGLTPLQLTKLLAQHPCCWICGRHPQPGKKRYVDHDHKTGRVRGVLCFTCNYRLLGKGTLNNPELHEAAAAYLRSTFDARKDL